MTLTVRNWPKRRAYNRPRVLLVVGVAVHQIVLRSRRRRRTGSAVVHYVRVIRHDWHE